MQRDLLTVNEWTNQWGMRLNLEKFKVLHFGRNNPKASNILRDKFGQIKEIGHSNTESDFGGDDDRRCWPKVFKFENRSNIAKLN